jgi:hypothetical protein
MKKVHYYSAAVRRMTALVASAVLVVSIQGCQEEVIKPGDEHREPTKHPPTEDGFAPKVIDGTNAEHREPTKHPAKVTVPEIKLDGKVEVSDIKVSVSS